MSRTQLPAQTLGEAVEALNLGGELGSRGPWSDQKIFPKKKKSDAAGKFFGGWKHWLIDAFLQLNACKNLHHCNMQQGSFTMAKDLNHRQFSSNLHLRISGLGVDPILEIGKFPVLFDIPSLPSTKIATWNYMPTQCLVNFKECRGSDYRKTTLQTNGSPNKKDSNQISSSTAPHWFRLPVGTRSYSHCGCDVTVGISPQGWFGRINLHAWWFNGHTIDSPICYTKANLADLPWFSQHCRWVFARFFSMSCLSVRFFEGHFLVLEFTTLEFGSSFGWSDCFYETD